MSKLSFLSENLLTQYDADLSMVVGTENSNFPLDNIKKKFTTKVFRSNENTCEVLIDLKQSRSVDYFMLVGNALTGLGLSSLTIQGSATTNFTGVTEITVDLNSDFNVGFVQVPEQSVRYWKLNMTGVGLYNEISNIFIGKADIIQNNSISISSFKVKENDLSSTSRNDYGQEFTDKRSKQTQVRGNIQYCNSEEVLQIDNILKRHTDKTPVWVIIDSNNNITTDGKYRFSGYFSLQNSPEWTASGYGLFNISLNLRQVI